MNWGEVEETADAAMRAAGFPLADPVDPAEVEAEVAAIIQATGEPHAGRHMVNRQVAFRLRDSDQANTFNAHRWGELLTGPVLVAYDSYVVVRVDGWRFGHTVQAANAALVEEAQR